MQHYDIPLFDTDASTDELVGFKSDYVPVMPYTVVFKYGNGKIDDSVRDGRGVFQGESIDFNEKWKAHDVAVVMLNAMLHAVTAPWHVRKSPSYSGYVAEIHAASGLGTSKRTLVATFDKDFIMGIDRAAPFARPSIATEELAFHIMDAIREYETGDL